MFVSNARHCVHTPLCTIPHPSTHTQRQWSLHAISQQTYSESSSLTLVPPYSGSSTLSPSLTLTGTMSPLRDLRPGPTARTVPWLICGAAGRHACSRHPDDAHRGPGQDREQGHRRACYHMHPFPTLAAEDSGSRMPPAVLVGATIFSTSTRSSRGINRLAADISATRAMRKGTAKNQVMDAMCGGCPASCMLRPWSPSEARAREESRTRARRKREMRAGRLTWDTLFSQGLAQTHCSGQRPGDLWP